MPDASLLLSFAAIPSKATNAFGMSQVTRTFLALCMLDSRNTKASLMRPLKLASQIHQLPVARPTHLPLLADL